MINTMDMQKRSKLQKLLGSWLPGTLATVPWLESLGISRSLVQRYKYYGWIISFGTGAYIRPKDTIEWFGALYTLQTQMHLPVHLGGKTALELLGHRHFIPLGQEKIDFFSSPKTILPLWLRRHTWKEAIRTTQSNILPSDVGLDHFSMGSLSIITSCRERAVLELLHLTPRLYDFEEVTHLMHAMGTLRPNILMDLLKECHSEKAKRLLLYFGEKQKHPWRSHLNAKEVSDCSYLLKITPKNGKYIASYNLYIPREYVIQNEQTIEF